MTSFKVIRNDDNTTTLFNMVDRGSDGPMNDVTITIAQEAYKKKRGASSQLDMNEVARVVEQALADYVEGLK